MEACIPLLPFTPWGHQWDWANSDDTNGTACCTSTVRVPCAKCGLIKTVIVDG